MAEENASALSNLATNFSQMPVTKQAGALLALSLSVAMGFYVVLWAQEPMYTPIAPHIELRDINAVVSVLLQEKIPYKLDESSGTLLVSQNKLATAKIALASRGLPQGAELGGFEILDKNQPFGSSQFLESVRYRRALEGELSKTISSMQSVNSARVHLAIPKEAIFLKDKERPTASVMVEVQVGRELQKSQVNAIVHLVASSIPSMQHQDVTVVDQSGRLLSAGGEKGFDAISEHLDYTRQLEGTLNKRILDLLTPIIGNNRVRAEVSADVDFTLIEETQEKFDPKSQVIRSERSMEEARTGGGALGGIPGALSNQPSQAGQAPEKVDAGKAGSVAIQNSPVSNKTQMTRNYEVDKSVQHVRATPGQIKRLSVAVLVDDKVRIDKKGKETKVPFTEAELKKMEDMVKDAIGFDSKRGDKVSVVNTTFIPEPKIEAPPEETLLDKPWVLPLGKQVLAGLFVLIVMLRILRPYFKSLSEKSNTPVFDFTQPPPDTRYQSKPEVPLKLPNLSKPSAQSLSHVSSMVKEDPKRVAKVVMNWVGNEDE